MRKTLLTLCVALALAGCGGQSYDEAAHRADVEAASGPVEDWPRLRDNMRGLCFVSDEQFAWTVRVNAEAGIDLDVHIKHLCPERLTEARAAKAE